MHMIFLCNFGYGVIRRKRMKLREIFFIILLSFVFFFFWFLPKPYMTDIINGSNVEPMGYQKMDRENNFLNRGQGFLRIQPSIFTRLAGEGPKIVVAHHLEFWSFLGALCSTFPWHVNVFKLNDKTAAFFMDTVKRKNQRKKLVPFISSFIIVVCYWESWILPAELVQFPEPSTSWAYLRYRNYSKPFPGLFFFFPSLFHGREEKSTPHAGDRTRARGMRVGYSIEELSLGSLNNNIVNLL